MTWFRRNKYADVLQKLNQILANQQEEKQQRMIDTTKLDAQDQQILQTVAALGPLVQTAVDDISKVTASDAAGQAIIDKHTTTFQGVADALTALQNSLNAAENSPAPPAPPAPPPPATS